MRKGVLIAGYYGAGNTGDEAILSGMISALKSEGIKDITVLSRNPEETRGLHGVDSIYCGRRTKGLASVFRCMRRSQLFILGGGGLLQDYTSRVVPYWLSRAGLAMAAGTPVMYYGQGIGPLRTVKAKNLVRRISNRVRYITVRDEESRILLQELGVNQVPVEVTADPALGIVITSHGHSLLEKAGVSLSGDKLKVAVSLRSWEGEEQYLPVLVNALRDLRRQFPVQYIFFPFQYGCDEGVSRLVLESLGTGEDCIVGGKHTPEQVAAMLKEMDAVIAMRLHAVILSALSCIPAFGLIYDPKVKCFMERAGIADYSVNLDDIVKDSLLPSRLAAWLAKREEISQQMSPGVAEMTALAARNARIARDLISS